MSQLWFCFFQRYFWVLFVLQSNDQKRYSNTLNNHHALAILSLVGTSFWSDGQHPQNKVFFLFSTTESSTRRGQANYFRK